MRRKRKGLKKETTEWINRSKRRSQEDEERERERVVVETGET